MTTMTSTTGLSAYSDVTLDFTQFADLVWNVLQPAHQACVAVGPPGCGKTKTLFAIARSMQAAEEDFGSCYYNFGGAEVMQAMGVLKNSPDLMTRTGVPPWMRPYPDEQLRGVFRDLYNPVANDLANLDAMTALNPYAQGIAIFDEPKTSPDPSLPLALTEWWCEGKIGDWGVPTGGWARIGLTNDISDRSAAKAFFAHERNRLLIVHLRPSLTDQCEVWRRMGMRKEFVLFARSHAKHVLSMNVPTDDRQFGTARSWTEAYTGAMAWMVNKLELDIATDPLPMDDHVFGALIAGRVGSAIWQMFRTFMTDSVAVPSYEEIIADPTGIDIPIDPMKQKWMADAMVYSAELQHLPKLVSCATRMSKAMAGMFYAGASARFGSAAGRQKGWLDFGDWCGHGAKLVAAGGLED